MKKNKNIVMVLAGLMLLALLLCFEKIAEAVGGVLNIDGSEITKWARVVLSAAIGTFLVYSGAAAMAVPFVGASLIVVGAVTVIWALWPLYQDTMDD